MTDIKAREGQWYADRVHHEFFLVISIDESDGLIDVRDRYGDIDEFDLDEWDSMDLVLCAAPAEWDAEDEDTEELRPSELSAHHFRSSGTT
jgi:hypothetical protein